MCTLEIRFTVELFLYYFYKKIKKIDFNTLTTQQPKKGSYLYLFLCIVICREHFAM